MGELELEEYLAEGAERLVAAILDAQLLAETDDLWAAAIEVEQLRAEIEAATGVSLIEPIPAAAFLDTTQPRNDHGRVGGTVAP